jgi:predicted ATPase
MLPVQRSRYVIIYFSVHRIQLVTSPFISFFRSWLGDPAAEAARLKEFREKLMRQMVRSMCTRRVSDSICC